MTDVAVPALIRDRPPGPPGLPFFGSLLSMQNGNVCDFMVQVQREHGPLVSYRLGSTDFWQFGEPEDIEEVLVRQHRIMHKDEIYGKLARLLGKGLVTSEGELWRSQRKIASRPFSRKQVDLYCTQMREIADRYLERGVGERDVYADMNKITEHIVLEVLFGVPTDATTEQVGVMIEDWMFNFHLDMNTLQRLLPAWFPTPARRRAWAAQKGLEGIIGDIVNDKKAGSHRGDDMLSRLLVASEQEGGMSAEQLYDEAVTMYVAGHETTALALTYTLRRLAMHPGWQARVRDEIRAVLPDGPRTAEDARKLPTLKAVLQESMRLDPPVWAVGREPTEDCVIAGRHCPKGTQLVVSQYVMHRDPRWFYEPESWRPERWLDGLEKRLPRFAYFPFGGGPRVCIGNHFAMLEALIILARILATREVSPVDDLVIEQIPTVTLRPAGPVRMALEPV